MGKTPEQLAEMFSPRLKALGLGSNATTVEVADAARGSGGATNRLLAPFLNQTLNTSPAQVGQLEMDKPAISAADQLARFNQQSTAQQNGPSPNQAAFSTGASTSTGSSLLGMSAPYQFAPPIGTSAGTRASLFNNSGFFGTGPGSSMGMMPGMAQPTGGAIGNAFPSVGNFGASGGGQGMALEGKYGLSAGNSSPFPIRGDLSVVKMAQGGEASKWSEQQLADAGKFIASNIDNPAEIERVRAHIEKATGMDISAGDLINAASRSGVTLAAPTAGVLSGDVAPSTWTQQNLIDAGNFIAQNIDNPAAIEAARANVEQATGQNISSLDLLRAAQSAQQPAQLSRAMADVLSGDVYGGMTARQAYDWITKGVIDQPQLSAQTAQNVMRNLGISSRDLAQAALLDPRISAGAQYALTSTPLYQSGQQSGLAALNENLRNFINKSLQAQSPTQAEASLRSILQSGLLTGGKALNEYDVQRATGKTLSQLFGPQVLPPTRPLPPITEPYVPRTAPAPEAAPPALSPGASGLDPSTAIVGNIPVSEQVKIPQLDAEFRASAPRTPVYDRLGRVTGYEYTPAAKLAPATGTTVFNWTPPGVTSRPRQLLNMRDIPGATVDPVTGETRMPLSASQQFARDRAQLDREFRQMYAQRAATDSSIPAQAPAAAAQAFRELAMSDPAFSAQLRLRELEQQRFEPTKADMALRAQYGAAPYQAALSNMFLPFITRNLPTLQSLVKTKVPLYSEKYPDIAAEYAKLSAEDKEKFPTIADYEQFHYQTYGQKEGRDSPTLGRGDLTSPYTTRFLKDGGAVSTEDFIAKKSDGGDVSRETLPPVRLADGSPNPDEVPSVIDERDEIRSESQRMLNRLASQSKLPPGLQRTIQGARARQGESMVPAAVPARDVMAGMFGAQAMNPGSEAYRTGQALANSPPVEVLKAPAKIASAAGDAATALASLGGAGVIKPKGGNWFKDISSVEGHLENLKTSPTVRQNPPDVLERIIGPGKMALDNWVDKKLTKYVKNEMGTPEDPVRALAERGILHMPTYDPDDIWETPALRLRRQQAGMPMEPQGQSETARFWEQTADRLIDFTTPSKIKRMATHGAWEHQRNYAKGLLEENPWINDVPANTKIYSPSLREDFVDNAGFGHIIDELENAMHPESDLPTSLRIQPKDLEKITVPQAVEKVAKINDWRAKEAAKAEREGMLRNLQATPRLADNSLQLSFVDKPGGSWVDIPETTDPKGLALCTSIGRAGGWCTQGDYLAESYGSGEHRLTALVDAEGRPHAQAKITENDWSVSGEGFTRLDPQTKAQYGQYVREWRQRNPEVEELTDDDVIQALREAGVKGPAPDITELKPPGNSFDSERAIEYAKRDPDYKAKVTDSVVRFLNSGEWGDVSDLHLYGIVDLKETGKRVAEHSWRAIPSARATFDKALKAQPTAPRFMTLEQFTKFLGYKNGGEVKLKHGGPVDKTTAFIKAHA